MDEKEARRIRGREVLQRSGVVPQRKTVLNFSLMKISCDSSARYISSRSAEVPRNVFDELIPEWFDVL